MSKCGQRKIALQLHIGVEFALKSMLLLTCFLGLLYAGLPKDVAYSLGLEACIKYASADYNLVLQRGLHMHYRQCQVPIPIQINDLDSLFFPLVPVSADFQDPNGAHPTNDNSITALEDLVRRLIDVAAVVQPHLL